MTKPEKYHQQLLKLKAFHEQYQNPSSPTEAHDCILQLQNMVKWVGKLEKQIHESIVSVQKEEMEREQGSVLVKLFTRNQDTATQTLRAYELELQFAEMIRQSATEITLPKLKMFIAGMENAGIPPVNYKQYIQSTEWRMKAEEAKANAGNRCQICNKSRAEVQLDAHHRTYDRLGDEQPQDITVLCRDCHQLYEDKKKGRVESVVVVEAKCRQCGNPFQPLSDYHQYCMDCYLATKAADEAKVATPEPEPTKASQGFCIRCQTDIKLNPQSPYCYKCFKSWKRYANDDYLEKACHVCGKPHEATRIKPVCYSCYKATKNSLTY